MIELEVIKDGKTILTARHKSVVFICNSIRMYLDSGYNVNVVQRPQNLFDGPKEEKEVKNVK